MTRVKICGLTRAEDVQLATQLGAEYLGFIFVRESPRFVEPEFVR
ncbi:MAG: phosphoribosylanthranilate isomerase, partial [Thermoanaerobaculia bacterium]